MHQGLQQPGDRIDLTLEGEGLLLKHQIALLIVVNQNSADFLGHHRRQRQFPAHRRQHPMGTALHCMGGLMQKHLGANAKFKAQRGNPERAGSQHELPVMTPVSWRSHFHLEPMALQGLRQWSQSLGQGRRRRVGGVLAGRRLTRNDPNRSRRPS